MSPSPLGHVPDSQLEPQKRSHLWAQLRSDTCRLGDFGQASFSQLVKGVRDEGSWADLILQLSLTDRHSQPSAAQNVTRTEAVNEHGPEAVRGL